MIRKFLLAALLALFTASAGAQFIDLSKQVTGNLATSHLNSGTAATSSTFWRGDGTWAAPAGSGTINAGTVGQVLVYTGATTASGADAPCVTGTPAAGDFLYFTGVGVSPCNYTQALAHPTVTGTFPRYNGTGIVYSNVIMTDTVTSGGMLYGSAANTVASTGALTANLPIFGGGAGVAPFVGTRSGNTTQVVTTTGTQTSGDCVKIDASGNHIANGSACGGGSGTVTTVSVTTANGVSGSVANATTTPAITLTLGAITPTTINGNTWNTGTGTLVVAAGKTLTQNQSITHSGTDGTTMTYPATSATLARTDAGQTFTGNQFLLDGRIAETVTAVTGNQATVCGTPGATMSSTANFHNLTVPTNNFSVCLPICNAAATGMVHTVTTGIGSNNVLVFGNATNVDTINGIASATGIIHFSLEGATKLTCVGGAPGNWIRENFQLLGTGNQVNIGQANSGALTLSTPQDIGTASSVQFANISVGAQKRMSTTATTLASGGCTTPGAVSSTGTTFALASVGTGCSGSQPLVFTLTAATTGWQCYSRNVSNGATSFPRQTGATSTTSVTITNFAATTGLAGAWTDADKVEVSCIGY